MTQYEYIAFAVLAFVVGACIGSFVNVLIWRVPRGISTVRGRSFCPRCGKEIRFCDNIPILSWLLLRGRCRDCHAPISPRYIAVEILVALLWLLSWLLSVYTGVAYALVCMAFSAAAVAVAFIDGEHGFIPDRFTLFILLAGVVACVADPYVTWWERLLGAGFCLLFFGGSYAGARLILKREGMGLGDVKFMTAVGLVLGIRAAFFAVLLSCVLAAAVLSVLSVRHRDGRPEDAADQAEASDSTANRTADGTPRDSTRGDNRVEYPFAPFLVFGSLVAAFAGNALVDLYFSLF